MDVRTLIDALSVTKNLSEHGPELRKFLISVCALLESTEDGLYRELLALGRACMAGTCDREQVRRARDKSALADDALRDKDPQRQAAIRAVRFLLHSPDDPVADWFDILWFFVDEAEAAGVSDAQLAEFLKRVFPDLESAAKELE